MEREDTGSPTGRHVGGGSIPLAVRKSARARRLRLEVHPGSLVLTIPRGCSEDRVDAFLRSQASWIETNTAAWRTLAAPGEGPLSAAIPAPGTPGWILFRGDRLPIRSTWTQQSRCEFSHTPALGLEVSLPEKWAGERGWPHARRALNRWFDGILRGEAEALVTSHGAPHGLIPDRIGFGAPRTRWGSCSSRGTLRLNRRLIGAPPAVFRYVVLHELAHLRFHHHRSPFWELVSELDPEWQTHADWLRRYGVALS